jgi:hypothetical protein
LESIPVGKFAVLRREGNDFSVVDFYQDEAVAEEVARKMIESHDDILFYVATSNAKRYIDSDKELKEK